jgi:hypothetical protein
MVMAHIWVNLAFLGNKIFEVVPEGFGLLAFGWHLVEFHQICFDDLGAWVEIFVTIFFHQGIHDHYILV